MAAIDGETGMYLLREALEGLIEPKTASGVIFEALGDESSGELPADVDGLLAFVQGPLRRATGKRVGESSAREVVERLEQVLDRVSKRPGAVRSGSTTLEVPVSTGPVRVLVLSRSSTLAMRLRAALGGDRIAVGAATAVPAGEHLRSQLKPEMVIVDAVDPVQDGLEALVGLLGSFDPSITILLWGREQEWAERLDARLGSAGVETTPVDRREGVDPLLDLIRSRPRTLSV